MSDSTRKIITDAITRMLARREHSSSEIATKLAHKGFSSDEFVSIISEFAQAGIQSDLRFAQSRVRLAASKGQGVMRIRAELASHGIAAQVIQTVIEQSDIDWFELALQVRHKKFGSAIPENFKERQKQSQFLHYRGFSSEQIRYAMGG